MPVTTLGGDGFLARYSRSFPIAASSAPTRGRRAWRRWGLVLSGVLCGVTAMLVVPYIRDFGPHGVDDPAMLLFILLMLGAMLMGIHFVRLSTAPK